MVRTIVHEKADGIFEIWWYLEINQNLIHITRFFNRKEYELWIHNIPSGIVFKTLKKAQEAMDAWVSINGEAK